MDPLPLRKNAAIRTSVFAQKREEKSDSNDLQFYFLSTIIHKYIIG